MTKEIMSKAVREYLRAIGQRGGIARGKAKRRGDAAHYANLARKRWGKPAQSPKP